VRRWRQRSQSGLVAFGNVLADIVYTPIDRWVHTVLVLARPFTGGREQSGCWLVVVTVVAWAVIASAMLLLLSFVVVKFDSPLDDVPLILLWPVVLVGGSLWTGRRSHRG
jgi:hypothetical protein